jgi:hypothetical protein
MDVGLLSIQWIMLYKANPNPLSFQSVILKRQTVLKRGRKVGASSAGSLSPITSAGAFVWDSIRNVSPVQLGGSEAVPLYTMTYTCVKKNVCPVL